MVVYVFFLIGVMNHDVTSKTKTRENNWEVLKHACMFSITNLEIQQRVQLVLNDRQRFDQLLRVHGAHDSINTAPQTDKQSELATYSQS